MTDGVVDVATIEALIETACRAPSLHNSQPWKWVIDGKKVHLYADDERLLPITDNSGRQLSISCGAALDHLRVAAAGTDLDSHITRFPDPGAPDLLATVEFQPAAKTSEEDRTRAKAILHRRTDRLVFLPPRDWQKVSAVLHDIAIGYDARVEEIPPRRRAELAHVSHRAAALHRYDSTYKAELQWWTGRSTLPDGIPVTAVPSRAEASRVPFGRAFPVAEKQPMHRVEVGVDRSQILVLTTPSDSREDWLRCGEALSTILLECTARGLATCPLTHMTELPDSRSLIREMLTGSGVPQVIVRVGSASAWTADPLTPRRPLADVLTVRPTAG
ncbi:nitroreductase family protein [Antrihabitans sp. YC3-6]|uniref:Nitroreductase family protein n=1 Tax=Antrihabitans stalagmiti TaxID=2799499 RepID=A0A934NTR9_9NOCA|nr:nitroreductase family protein [Antrihabitans stalagmiti]MBJ8341271.1 nitroreductase family protein [Antrihabitans stalagmiti]